MAFQRIGRGGSGSFIELKTAPDLELNRNLLPIPGDGNARTGA
jgi:hypothetical protein